jgi:hypothetical protein
VKDHLHTLNCALADIRRDEIADQQLDAVKVGEILPPPGRKIVDDANLVSLPDESFRQMRSDEPGPARDEALRSGD